MFLQHPYIARFVKINEQTLKKRALFLPPKGLLQHPIINVQHEKEKKILKASSQFKVHYSHTLREKEDTVAETKTFFDFRPGCTAAAVDREGVDASRGYEECTRGER